MSALTAVVFLIAYHQEVRFGESRGLVQCEDAGSRQVLWQRNPQMRVVKRAHVLRLGRIGKTTDAGLYAEVCLSQSASLDENFHCAQMLDDG